MKPLQARGTFLDGVRIQTTNQLPLGRKKETVSNLYKLLQKAPEEEMH